MQLGPMIQVLLGQAEIGRVPFSPPINQIIAQRIIEGARTGVRDPGDLTA
jgi:hypothetical protein